MYNLATIVENQQAPDGSLRLMIEFTGDAGESIKRPFTVTGTSTNQQLRQWVGVQIAELNNARNLADIPALQVGQTITPAALPSPPTPTAAEIWVEKANRLRRAESLALTDAEAVADIAALRADVNATYQSAYLGKV